jgi:hypothetical protein
MIGVGGRTSPLHQQSCLFLASTAEPLLGIGGCASPFLRRTYLCLAAAAAHLCLVWVAVPLLATVGRANAWRRRPRLSLVLTTTPFIGVAGRVCAWRCRSLLLTNALLLCCAPLPPRHYCVSLHAAAAVAPRSSPKLPGAGVATLVDCYFVPPERVTPTADTPLPPQPPPGLDPFPDFPDAPLPLHPARPLMPTSLSFHPLLAQPSLSGRVPSGHPRDCSRRILRRAASPPAPLAPPPAKLMLCCGKMSKLRDVDRNRATGDDDSSPAICFTPPSVDCCVRALASTTAAAICCGGCCRCRPASSSSSSSSPRKLPCRRCDGLSGWQVQEDVPVVDDGSMEDQQRRPRGRGGGAYA